MADSILSQVPSSVAVALASLGALVIGSKVLSYAMLLLDLFVLKGTNVRIINLSLLRPQQDCH